MAEDFFIQADVTAIIVAYNSAHRLAPCLAALQREGITQIVIVDNASTDGLVDWMAQHAPAARRVANAINEGFGRGMNKGVAAATTALCLLINPDAILQPGALAELLRATNDYPEAALFGPTIIEHDAPVFTPRAPLSFFLPNPQGIRRVPTGDSSTPFLSGACYLLRRDAFLRLGGFDPNIFLYYEDDDLCRRMSEARLGPIYVPAAVARHEGSASTAPRPGLVRLLYWHRAWSRLYIAQKYGLRAAQKRRVLTVVLRHGLKYLLALVKNDSQKQERFSGGAAGAWAFLTGRTAREQQKLS